METQVRTPQLVFMQPQRLIVPLFQRPYVWNEENQWEPLWNDVARIAERLLKRPNDKHQPHFLGAVVLQQVANQTGLMQSRTIIDGQQRLTTLQLLIDALHAELQAAGAAAPAARLDPLITNSEPFCRNPEDRFKVWPTNRDRAPFNAVMGATPPVDHDATGHRGERMVEAHRFFSEQIREWILADGPDAIEKRGIAIETVTRDLLQMVVIDLTAEENAQEIFETLNARGAQLTAADLIKNFIFQRLLEGGTDVEAAYQKHWKDFETAFWEKEVNVGRIRYPRSSIFLNHWLISRTGEEVVAREVFDRFKRYADYDVDVPMSKLLVEIHEASKIYSQFVDAAKGNSGQIDRLGLFGYRTSVLESEVIKPLLLCLLDPELPEIPDAQFTKALEVVESWMVRRMLVRASTKSYNQVMAELINQIRETKSARNSAGDVVEKYLAAQTSGSGYWPDDEEIREELQDLPAYRRLRQGRLRMVLEAIEDHLRGWKGTKSGLGGERVARAQYAIEHVMPNKWLANWPLGSSHNEQERDRMVHTLGNLTLLTGKLNSKVSNGPWDGADGKRSALEAHDVLILTRDLLRKAENQWSDEAIYQRTRELIGFVIKIWPVPEGHRSGYLPSKPRLRKRVQLSDLISAGVVEPGITLFPRTKKYQGLVATLLPDGRIEFDGIAYSSPSDAASAMTGGQIKGWWFFLVDEDSKRSLQHIRREYVDQLSLESDEDDDEDDDD